MLTGKMLGNPTLDVSKKYMIYIYTYIYILFMFFCSYMFYGGGNLVDCLDLFGGETFGSPRFMSWLSSRMR